MNALLVEIRGELVRRITGLDVSDPVGVMQEEPLSDHVVELTGLRHAVAGASGLVADLLTVLAEDLAHRLGLLPWPGALPRAAKVLPRLLPGQDFESALDVTEKLVPVGVSGRLAEPCETIRADLAGLRAIFADEWHGADPVIVSAGGAELVLRVGRLILAATLVRVAADTTGDPDQPVTVARRYAWRWLRDPVPEAATPTHRRRTAVLLNGCGVL
jgi:hypothetical protein